jgi:hypothetical protein
VAIWRFVTTPIPSGFVRRKLTSKGATTLPTENFPDDLIPDTDAAEDLRVKEGTLASWRSMGRGPDYWKLGRGVFYSRKVNAEWKAQQRRSPRVREV